MAVPTDTSLGANVAPPMDGFIVANPKLLLIQSVDPSNNKKSKCKYLIFISLNLEYNLQNNTIYII